MNIINGDRVRMFTVSGKLRYPLVLHYHAVVGLSNHNMFSFPFFRSMGSLSCGLTLFYAILVCHGQAGVTLLSNLQSSNFIYGDIIRFCTWTILLSLSQME